MITRNFQKPLLMWWMGPSFLFVYSRLTNCAEIVQFEEPLLWMQALRKSLNADILEDWAAYPERWCWFWSPVVFRRPPTQDLLIHSVFFFFQMALPGILLSLELGLQPKGFWRSVSFLNGPPWDSSQCGTYLLAQELLLLTRDRKRY